MALLCFSKRFRWVIVRCSSSSRFFCQRFSSCGQAKKLSAKRTKLHYSQTLPATQVWVFIAQLVEYCSIKTQRPLVRIPLGPNFFFGLIICNILQAKPSFVVFGEEEKSRLSESQQPFEVAAARTSRLVNLVLSCQTGFFECEHPFIGKPMVITELAVASTRLSGLGLKLYPSNMPSMHNEDVT